MVKGKAKTKMGSVESREQSFYFLAHHEIL